MFAMLASGTELRRFSKGIMPRIAIFILLFIPLLYGALYLWAFWNPTDHMDNLPVALVNEDAGATANDGTRVSAGSQIVDQLVEGQDLKWVETDAATAASGVQDGDYYFSVTIPAGFSAATVSPGTDDPSAAQIEVSYNDANSFLASTLGKTAMLTLRNAVAQEIGQTQVNAVLLGLNDASDGLATAADGAGNAKKGAETAQSGSETITVNLDTLAAGLGSLDAGSGTLASGLTKIASGSATLSSGLRTASSGASDVSSGASTLADGLKTLKSGSASLTSGASALSGGASTLSDGLRRLESAVIGPDGLSTGTASLASGASALSGGLKTLSGTVGTAGSTDASTLAGGLAAVSSGVGKAQTSGAPAANPTTLAQSAYALKTVAQAVAAYCDSSAASYDATTCRAYLSKMTALSTGIDTAVNVGSGSNPALATALTQLETAVNTTAVDGSGNPQGLAAALTALSGGAATLSDGTASLDSGVNGTGGLADSVSQLSDGGASLASGAATLSGGAKSASSGITKLTNGSKALASGASTLASGVTKLSSGASSLKSATASASSGAASLSDGAASASSGAGKLAAGSATLTDGLGTLSDGLGTLSTKLSDGAATTNQGSTAAVEAKSSVIADPVTLDQSYTNEASSWGEGFAPFFIALALFVGGIITWLLLHALPRRAIAAGVSGLRAAMAGFLPAAVFGVGQVAIMMAVLILGLGLSPNYLVGTVLFVLLTALTFLALQQMFIITLGTAAGRVVALALLMFQLSSSGGTYPVETTPGFFQAIHPWMPISYVVTGLRQFLTGQVDAQMWTSVLVLAGILVGSLAISAVAAARQRVWSMSRLHPEIAI